MSEAIVVTSVENEEATIGAYEVDSNDDVVSMRSTKLWTGRPDNDDEVVVVLPHETLEPKERGRGTE